MAFVEGSTAAAAVAVVDVASVVVVVVALPLENAENSPPLPPAFLDDTQGRTRGCRKIFADKLFGIAIRYRKELQILLNIEKDERKVI